MVSLNPLVRWELVKPTVRQLYLVENKTLPEVLKELKDKSGFKATKAQLEFKLKQWKMLKNFPPHVWNVVEEEIKKRKRDGKPESEVIHYGVPLSADKVRRATARYSLPKLAVVEASPSSAGASSEMPVWIRTPPASPVDSLWPQDLPWFSFQQQLMEVLAPLSNLCIEDVSSITDITATQLLETFGHRAQQRQQNPQGPVPMYSMLSILMPESFSGENLVRSEALYQAPRRSAREAIEMVFYVLSNNIQHTPYESEELDLKLLGLLKSSGLLKTSIRVFISSQQPSALAVVDQLFGAAIRTGDANVAAVLLGEGLNPNQMVPLKSLDARPICLPDGFVFLDAWSMRGLHIALSKGYMALAKVLVEGGADTAIPTDRFSTLDFAVFASTVLPEAKHEPLHLILRHRGPDLTQAEWLAALEHASFCFAKGSAKILLDHYKASMSLTQGLRDEALVHAIRAQDDDLVRMLIDNGVDPNATLDSGGSAMWEAVYAKRYDICEMLINCGFQADLVQSGRPTQLQCASYRGDLEIVRLLLKQGADVNHNCGNYITAPSLEWSLLGSLMLGTTALEAALYGEMPEAAFFLLEAGASLTGSELAIAVRMGLTDVIDHLLYFQLDLDLGNDSRGESALEAAIATGRSELAITVLELSPLYYDASSLCASVHMATLSEDYSIVENLLDRRVLFDPADDLLEGTALAIAVHFNNGPVANLFFERGIQPPLALFPSVNSSLTSYRDWGYADMNDRELLERWGNECGWWRSAACSTSHYHHRHDTGSLDIISVLQAAVSDRGEEMVSLLLGMGYEPDSGSLRKAATVGSVSTLEMFLVAGADVNGRRAEDSTALQAAVWNRHPEIVKILLEYGADVNADPPRSLPSQTRARACRTALQHAVELGDTQMIDLLIDHGADIHAPPADDAGATALQLAAMQGFLGVARKLLQLGANVNAPGARRHGRTALEGSAEHGRLDMLQLLLSYGADIHEHGQSPLLRAIEFAEKNGHYASVRLLESYRVQKETRVDPVGSSVPLASSPPWTSSAPDCSSRVTAGQSSIVSTEEIPGEDWFEEFVMVPPDKEE